MKLIGNCENLDFRTQLVHWALSSVSSSLFQYSSCSLYPQHYSSNGFSILFRKLYRTFLSSNNHTGERNSRTKRKKSGLKFHLTFHHGWMSEDCRCHFFVLEMTTGRWEWAFWRYPAEWEWGFSPLKVSTFSTSISAFLHSRLSLRFFQEEVIKFEL